MSESSEIIERMAAAQRSPSNDSMSQSQTSLTSPTTETTPTTTNGLKGSTNGGESRKTSLQSPDPTSYVTKARVTRPIPPPPSYNPMQFVQIKPCNLYQTAQEQLKKAEEVKKIKEIKKEEPEDWQNNLDSWKSSRRKRVEHIIDRVVEVKKLELEEHDRTRRKSKTFSEMIEERGERGRPRTKLTSLAVYNEDESNDLSDLGIGTSSASGKSSLSEDYDNNSVTSDNADLDRAIQHNESDEQQQQQQKSNNIQMREYIASPGYETSSSTAPASSPDPCEYTYEGAIQDYKQRISRAASGNYGKIASTTNNNNNQNNNNTTMNGNGHRPSKSPPNTLSLTGNEQDGLMESYSPRRGNKIEDRLLSFEVTSPSDHQDGIEKTKVDLPKIDISKRKEIFESQQQQQQKPSTQHSQQHNGTNGIDVGVPKVPLRERFKFEANASSTHSPSSSAAQPPVKKDVGKRLSGEITSIRERLQSLEQQKKDPSSSSAVMGMSNSRSVDIPVPPLKDRLSSLQNAVKKEDVKKPPVALVDARQLEIMKNEEEQAVKQRRQEQLGPLSTSDLDDSGIQTTEDVAMVVDDQQQQLLQQQQEKEEQEEQLNAAIAALALEEKQLEEAANAVNQIEAEFNELSSTAAATATMATAANNANNASSNATNQPQLPYEMDFSINEALELALEAIDKETKLTANDVHDDDDDYDNDDALVEISSKTQIKIAIETTKQINQTTRIHQNAAATADPLKMMGEDEKMDKEAPKKNHNQRQEDEDEEEEVREQEMATRTSYVPHDVVLMSTKTKEPIYENISSSVSAVTTTTAIASVPNDDEDDLVIIPNGGNCCIDNNKHHHNQRHHHHHHHHNNHHNHNHHNNSSSNQNNYETNNANNNINHNNNNNNQIKTNTSNGKNKIKTTTTTTTTTIQSDMMKSPAAPALSASAPPPAALSPSPALATDVEPYYQVPKSSEPYYDAPKHLRPVPLYENIEVFLANGLESYPPLSSLTNLTGSVALEPPKEKPPPPPAESPPPIIDDNENGSAAHDNTDTDLWSSSDNTYETISTQRRTSSTLATSTKSNGILGVEPRPSPPIKRVNSTKRIKKELRNKRSSFLGIDASEFDDEDRYLEMTVAPPPDMAQFLQQERQLEKQLYMKAAGLCDSSDTGESRDSGVSENHSRQSSEHYTNSSEENERHIDVGIGVEVSPTAVYHHHHAAQTPLLQTVKGDSAESWTESATAAAAASQSLTEATATATAKMLSIEEKIREQEEVLRVERELLQLEQEELKRQRENLMLRENMARREMQHGAKMLMSANRRSLQEINGPAGPNALTKVPSMPMPIVALSQQMPSVHLQQQHPQQQQQIYANVPNLQEQYYQMDVDYRKSMSDLNEFSTKQRSMLPPTPPTKPMRAIHMPNGRSPAHLHPHPHSHSHSHPNPHSHQQPDDYVVMTANQRFGGSLVKIAAPAPISAPTAAPRSQIYSNYQHHRSQQNLCTINQGGSGSGGSTQQLQYGNMTRNTLHALSATPKPKYTDGWVQQQQQQKQQQQQQQHQNRKSLDPSSHLANDPAWLSAYQQKRKSMPDATGGSAFSAYNGNHWLVQEAEQRRIAEEQQRRSSLSNGSTPLHQKSNGKPLPDAVIQTLTERVQSKGIGERKRLDNFKNDRSPLHAASAYQQQQQQNHYPHESIYAMQPSPTTTTTAAAATAAATSAQDKVLSVSGKKKCSHCGDELGRGAAMIIESLLLFYHINCFKCCVCHVQLGDGLNGTDVRVRNHKLHCQNCYSSDDGIKFSCV